MEKILNKIPKPILIFIVLVASAIFIMIGDPPKNACDSQLENFLSAQVGKISSFNGKVGSLWSRTAKYCQKTKTLGGCSEFYNIIKIALRDLQNISTECVPFIVQQEKVQKILQDSLLMMIKMAWGAAPPEPGQFLFGWHGKAEFVLFCGLKKNIMRYKFENEWEVYMREIISQLPLASTLSFEEAFNRSLFTIRCDLL